jgi:hypothetical protein
MWIKPEQARFRNEALRPIAAVWGPVRAGGQFSRAERCDRYRGLALAQAGVGPGRPRWWRVAGGLAVPGASGSEADRWRGWSQRTAKRCCTRPRGRGGREVTRSALVRHRSCLGVVGASVDAGAALDGIAGHETRASARSEQDWEAGRCRHDGLDGRSDASASAGHHRPGSGTPDQNDVERRWLVARASWAVSGRPGSVDLPRARPRPL